MEWYHYSAGIVVAVITGLTANATSRIQAKSEKEVAEVNSRSQEWRSINETIKELSSERFEDYENRLKSLEDQFRDITDKYHKSLSHIVVWRQTHPDSQNVNEIPKEIENDLRLIIIERRE